MMLTSHYPDSPAFSAIHFGVKGNNPEQVFKFLAWEISKSCKLTAIETFDHFEQFCKDHVAGMGDGVALFDWMQPDLAEPVLVYARLEQPVALDTLDDRPVDMVVALISPSQEGPLHLQRLARLSRFFRNADLLARLRDATCVDGITAQLTAQPLQPQQTLAA